jgi:hypothetical protein
MAAEDALLFIRDYGSYWHLVESLVDLSEHTVGVVDVLTQSFCTLFAEAEVPIDVFVFVVAS